MAFSKSFPKTIKGSNYPVWEEVFLSIDEEKQCEERCKQDNIKLMRECLSDAKKTKEDIGGSESVKIACALFEKRARFAVHYKEDLAKEKFDKIRQEP